MPDWIVEAIFVLLVFFAGYVWGRLNSKSGW